MRPSKANFAPMSRVNPVALAIVVLIMILCLWLGVIRYRECRAHGFSMFFCASLE